MLQEYLVVLAQLVSAMNVSGIQYAIGGSVASSVHGTHRSTNDIDFAIRMSEAQVDQFVAALQSSFYIDDLSIRDAIDTASSFSVIHLETMIKADFFLSPVGEWEEAKWKRIHETNLSSEMDPLMVRVTAVEDMILQKLVWYRLGGQVSERQWRDILGMIEVQNKRLDRSYMLRWAEYLELSEMLKTALHEALNEEIL